MGMSRGRRFQTERSAKTPHLSDVSFRNKSDVVTEDEEGPKVYWGGHGDQVV